jgi:hypothetical protein
LPAANRPMHRPTKHRGETTAPGYERTPSGTTVYQSQTSMTEYLAHKGTAVRITQSLTLGVGCWAKFSWSFSACS